MKTTLEIEDRLLIEAKKMAAERRTTLRRLVEEGLRERLAFIKRAKRGKQKRLKIRWEVAAGGLPDGLDLADRTRMYSWIGRMR